MKKEQASVFSARKATVWVARTGVLIALLVVLQWATSPTQVFAGQFITGSCVNAVLAVAALAAGLWSGVAVAIVSPFFAFLLNIGPALLPIVPAIALGNLVYVLVLYFLAGRGKTPVWRMGLGWLAASVAKFLTLYLVVVKLLCAILDLKEKQIAAFTVMFSWPQLVTALIGGALAMVIVPTLRRVRKA